MSRRDALFVVIGCLVLYLAAIAVRPPLPIDETRYLTVAWEMYLRGDWLAPLTVNFEPYHHKPPLLFWMINLSWAVFGVSRWAATIPVTLVAVACVILTARLARRLAPGLERKVLFVYMGGIPFLLFSTLLLFDLTMTMFVLAALLGLLEYAASGRRWLIAFVGLCLGLGVLTKGPVAYLYVLFPVLLGPWWMQDGMRRKSWYLGALGALLISFIPVLLWLVPVLEQSSGKFAYWLVWEQTAGRVTGSYEEGHPRPFYFYLPILLAFCLPWLLVPRFWRGWRGLAMAARQDGALRFVLAWLAPTVLAFSLIGGKQAHYLVPLLPGLAILIARQLRDLATATLRLVAAGMLLLVVTAHVVLPDSVLKPYDLRRVADLARAHADTGIAFVRVYRGEVSFLARLRKPVDVVPHDSLGAWFGEHPEGIAVVSSRHLDSVAGYEMLYSSPYRNKEIGVIRLGKTALAAGATATDKQAAAPGSGEDPPE